MQQPISILEWEEMDSYISELEEGESGKKKSEKEKSEKRESEKKKSEKRIIKIDPPSYHTCSLQEMKENLRRYQDMLYRLQRSDLRFLNTPEAILQVLDKRDCKQRLQQAGIPVTKMVLKRVEHAEQLMTFMEEERLSSVFIKPVFFSGAAGVVALRIQPRTKQMMAYTSCKLVKGELVNTKTLYCLKDEKEITALLNAILELDVMIERWYPKSVFHGKSYDLRVVYQFGHMAHIVVRQSRGPVTNLHLNNQAVQMEELGLSEKMLEQIDHLCREAMELFPGLVSAGMDVLIEKNEQKPYIIEINGQGDLIYQDIFGENRIYKEQVLYLSQML